MSDDLFQAILVIGQRVAMRDGTIGHIEEIDSIFADVRALTPNNNPSCCVSTCYLSSLIPVPETVVPMKGSKEWWEEALSLHAMISRI